MATTISEMSDRARDVFRLVRPRPFMPTLVRLVVAAGALAAGALLQRGPVCGPGTQGMAPYDGAPTSVTVENFSAAGALMRFDVLIAPTPAAD